MTSFFKVPIYDVMVYVCRTPAEYNKCMTGFGFTNQKAPNKYGCASEVLIDNSEYLVIGVFNSSTATLVHECSHITDMIIEHRGISHPVDTEVRAYLLEYIFQEAEKIIKPTI